MSDSETHDNVVRNNIVIGSHNPQIYGESKSTVIDHNLTSGAPLFRDAAALDFHLQAASPAIGAGVNIPEVRYDHDGIARPQGKACDLGAYEHSADTFLPTTHQHSELYLAGQKFQTDIGFATK
jgi:hypothetical protein